MADHPPKRLLKNLMAFSALGKTGKLAEYELNVAVYGTLIYVNVDELKDIYQEEYEEICES